MNFDKSQFENLELDNIGYWPAAAKLMLTIFLASVVIGLGYFVLISDKINQLEQVQSEELTLRQSYEAKYHIAANLELFRAQMIEAEELFATQLKSLPPAFREWKALLL